MTDTRAGTGSLLNELMVAQERDDNALRYPAIERHAAALTALASRLGDPILWPTSPGGERLLGVVEVMSRGRARVRGWTTDVADEAVLIVDVVAVSPQAIVIAAAAARAQGATRVDACAVDVPQVDGALPGVDSFVAMT